MCSIYTGFWFNKVSMYMWRKMLQIRYLYQYFKMHYILIWKCGWWWTFEYPNAKVSEILTRKLLYMQLYIFHKTETDLQHACLQIITVWVKMNFKYGYLEIFKTKKGCALCHECTLCNPNDGNNYYENILTCGVVGVCIIDS